ncbi:IS630 family transposase [Orrella marina]|uniref:IS630 family transposase n=1 Tax=Orrella marina TaxID=2163011 RepID=A0A2R4XP48_9BURK|nr:IS630 family transposase [Orrella marina]AWB35574.1 IS630 family transposase [Orrella marina]
MAKPAAPFNLSLLDRETLQGWLRKSTLDQRLAQRARILLELGAGMTPRAVSEKLDVTAPVVFKWRKRYLEQGIEGLNDLPRPGQPRKLSEKKVREILDKTVHQVPKEATHWSLRLMAKYTDTTVWQVSQVWEAAGLKPHLSQTFKINNDPDFVEKVIDIVGLYMNPPDNAMVLSVDEKTQIQALDRTQVQLPHLPPRPGQVERRTHDDKRNGTASLYAAFDVASGKVIGRVTERHRAQAFLDFIWQIDHDTPKELDLHVILDNSSAHKTVAVKAWLERNPRIKLHSTPTSACWLEEVGQWFGHLEGKALDRGGFTSVKDLRETIKTFIDTHNKLSAKPFRWTKSADAILASVGRAENS